MPATRAMAVVFHALLEQVGKDHGLRSLLVATEHEDQRPRLKVRGDDYIVGLVGDKPMLLRERDKELVNPDLIGDGDVTEIVWKLK